ncbi:hypothetical protein G4O51_13485 [Candidatus Bathyarchaeota archaeon A05DMB-2]|jgi:hypothetical protein|nr:hypothetical protein [Candidatus Bathyarchaeota archaeon A05DMB-2]
MDVFSYIGKAVAKILRGEKLTAEEKTMSSFLSLAVVAAAVPLAIEAGVVTYSYGKSKGWWK